MSQETPQVVFLLDEQRYALYVRVVERVVRAVAITRLPKAPEIVLGVINLEGKLIPVLDIRKRFNLPHRSLRTSDRFVIARTASRVVALLVDSVVNVIDHKAGEIIPARDIIHGSAYISGVAKDEEGLVLIHDLDTFLSIEEESQLDNALRS